MKTSEVLEKLMKFIYSEYKSSDAFQSYGEYASIIVGRFADKSRIRLGDARAQLEYIRLLKRQGWIEYVSVDGSTLGNARLSLYNTRVKPSLEGIEHVEQGLQPGKAMLKAASAAAEIAGKGLKGFLGK